MGTHKAALPWSVGRVSGEEGGRLTVRYHRILTAAHHIVGGMEKGVGGRESGIDLLFVLFYSLVFVSPFFYYCIAVRGLATPQDGLYTSPQQALP